MGEITWEMRRTYGPMAEWIPAGVLVRIGQDEILDRLDEATTLSAKADMAPAEVARGHMEMAREVLAAEPRDEVEREAGRWLAKADGAYTAIHAAECRAQADRIRDANPAAPRRVRAPSPEEVRHAEALASLKADVMGLLEADPEWQGHRARMGELGAQVAAVTASVAEMSKTIEPHMTKVDVPARR